MKINETRMINTIDPFKGYVLKKRKLKLFQVDEDNGVIRLQSQLYIGTDEASHIFKGGVLYQWNNRIMNWSPCDFEFEIAYSKEELRYEPVSDYFYEKNCVEHFSNKPL